MKRIFLNFLLASALLLGSQWSTAQAATFAFFERSTGDALAEVDLSGSNTFTHTSITGFRFTAAGNAVFGVSEGPFTFPFDTTLNDKPITDQKEADGGLSVSEIGVAEFQTIDASMGPGGSGVDMFFMFFGNDINGPDQIGFSVDIFTRNATRITIDGDWEKAGVTPVPLPAGLPLLGAALGSLAFMRRKKTQQVRL